MLCSGFKLVISSVNWTIILLKISCLSISKFTNIVFQIIYDKTIGQGCVLAYCKFVQLGNNRDKCRFALSIGIRGSHIVC